MSLNTRKIQTSLQLTVRVIQRWTFSVNYQLQYAYHHLGMGGQCNGAHIYLLGRRARVLVLAAWLLSVLFSTPIFVLYEERLVQGKSDRNNWDLSEGLSAASFTFLPWHFCHNVLDIIPTQANCRPSLRCKVYHEITNQKITQCDP